MAARTIYAMVGISAFYQAVTLPEIRRRWKVLPIRIRGTGSPWEGSPVTGEGRRTG